MKRILPYLAAVAIQIIAIGALSGQRAEIPFKIDVRTIDIDSMPGLHSFAVGVHEGKWLLIGGRTDGLHMRQPWATFWAAYNNPVIYMVDPGQRTVKSRTLAGLDQALIEQLQSSNMQYYQDGHKLYITGGYGYSATYDDWITYPYFTEVDLSKLSSAFSSGNDISEAFKYLEDPYIQITGASMKKLGKFFYIVGGQRFTGRYNPMGPDHGPGFKQEYSNGVRRFILDADNFILTDKETWTDSMNMHRRDLNVAYQVDSSRTPYLTAYAGVFQYERDIPWTNIVRIDDHGMTPTKGFNQLYNHYHCAHTSIYNAIRDELYTVFFGGMARYYKRKDRVVKDDDVPFVNTIAAVIKTRASIREFKIGEMPGLFGASAVFIPSDAVSYFSDHVIDYKDISEAPLLLGYVVGGMESDAPNIFFENTNKESRASDTVFEIWVSSR